MECRRLVQIFLPALFLLLICGSARANLSENLYSVVIQTDDNSIATRNQLLPKAFAQVIQKVGSSQQILNHPEYQNASQHLDRFVSHYFYTENGDKYNLTLRFNEQMVNHLLAKMQRPTLGKNRPQVLLWLVLEHDNERHFITHDTDFAATNKIASLAHDFGLPMILPLFDLTERLFLNETDVMVHPASFVQAAQRYSTDTILLGKILVQGDAYQCDWHLIAAGNEVQWSANSPDINSAIETMVGKLADELIASKHRMQETQSRYASRGITVRIHGVKSRSDYARVMDCLKHFPGVQKVEVGSVANNQATFVVTAENGRAGLLSALKTSSILVVANLNQEDGNDHLVELTYRIDQ